MECKYCGKKLIDGAEYCVYCGKSAVEGHKENKKKERRSNNNNPVVVIVLIILLLVILFGGGIFVYKKFIEKPKTNNNNNNVLEKPVEEKEKIPSITKEETKMLIDTYYFVGRSTSENLFTISLDDTVKKNIAIKNINGNTKIISCDQIEGFALEGDICTNGKDKTTQGKSIDYETLNNKYKYLFGKQSEDIPKETIKSLNEITTWEYDASKNSFLETLLITGLEGVDSHVIYGIKDYSQVEDKLTVKVGYILIDPKEENDKVIYSTTIDGGEVTYFQEEVEKSTFDKEFLDKYLDKLDTYEFTFKYEEDHYVFESMKKI